MCWGRGQIFSFPTPYDAYGLMEQPSGLDSLYGILGGKGVREVFCVGGGGQNSGGSGGFLTAGDHTHVLGEGVKFF